VDYGQSNPIWAQNQRPILNDKMTSEKFYQFLLDMFSSMNKFVDGSLYICHSCKEMHNFHKAFTDAGFHWSTYIIWAKDRFVPGRSDYHHQHEPILFGFSESLAHSLDNSFIDESTEYENLPILYGWNKHKWYGGRKQGDVWLIKRPNKNVEHPTMKPVMLCAKAIINSCPKNGLVLDPFLGSGSTLIAAEKTGRTCYGMELDPHYVDVIIKRWEDYSKKKAVKLNGK